jgi:hypothetical protein
LLSKNLNLNVTSLVAWFGLAGFVLVLVLVAELLNEKLRP